MSRKSLIFIAPLVCCISCALSPVAESLQGAWVSDGYGIAAQVSGGRVETFAIADRTCLSEGGDPLFGLLAAFDVDMHAGGQSFLLRQQDSAQAIHFDRIAALPERCALPPDDTPTGNLEAFLDFYATHYAFFDLYGVDWDRQSAKARAQVTQATSDAQLFAVMQQAISPLKDGHIGLKARIDGTRRLYEPNPGALFSRLRQEALATGQDPREATEYFRDRFWHTHLRYDVLRGKGQMAGEGYVQYGLIGPDTGYLGFLTMAGFADGSIGDLQADLAAMHDILDAAIARFDQAKVARVVVDLSLNFGGYDEIALAIASRFATDPVFALSEYPYDATNPLQLRRTVMPSPRARYTGPLTLLTSDMTVSAGEILTLALRALPQTTHAGTATRGAFSDVLEKELPNGWVLELSNEVYADHRGIVWEGEGVRPDHPLAVFEGPDPMKSHRNAIDQLLAKGP